MNSGTTSSLTKSYGMKLNKGTDAEIIEKLDSFPSEQGYIKELIRKDIERAGK